MDSQTISHIRNITINKSFAKQKKRDKTRQNLFAQNLLVKISSSPKIRKSPRVKICREEDFRVAQFATSPNLSTLQLDGNSYVEICRSCTEPIFAWFT